MTPNAIPTRRTWVRVHDQAMQMLDSVQRHLNHKPEDAVYFLLDYEQALRDLGFELSKGMKAHFAERFPPTSPHQQTLYRKVKSGLKLPVDVTLSFRKPGEQSHRVVAAAPAQDAPLGSGGVSDGNALTAAGAAAVAEKTAGFSTLLQLEDQFINGMVAAAYESGLLPTRWQQRMSSEFGDLGISFDLSYDIRLDRPQISFDTSYAEGVALSLNAKAGFLLDVEIMRLLSPGQVEYRDSVPVDVAVSLRVVATAVLGGTADGRNAVYVDLKDIRDMAVEIDGHALPEDLLHFLEALLLRVARTELAAHVRFPLTFALDPKRDGVPVVGIRTHILPPSGGRAGTLSIGIDTGLGGDPSAIRPIIPVGSRFAVATSRAFLLGQIWPRFGASQFPQWPEPKLVLEYPEIDLQEGSIWFRINATYHVDCLPDIDATATANLNMVPEQRDGIWRAKLQTVGTPDIDIDTWDEIFYSFLLGFLVNLFVPGGLGPILISVLIHALEVAGEGKLGEEINDAFSMGFDGTIPDTRIRVTASTPIAPEIHSDGIFAHGDAVFRVMP